MQIKIFGTGCKKCNELEKEVKNVVAEMGIDDEVEKIEDMKKIVEAGIMLTPGLMINGKLKVTGKAPKKKDIIKYIEEER